jgi:hypothetical protein
MSTSALGVQLGSSEIHCRDQEAFYIAGGTPMVECDVSAAAA